MEPTVPATNSQFGLPAVPPPPTNSTAAAQNAGLPPAGSPQPVPPTLPDASSADLLVNAIAEAKRIEQQYRANPYQQNQALQQLKTNYLSSRYHINVKLTQN